MCSSYNNIINLYVQYNNLIYMCSSYNNIINLYVQ